MRLFAKNRDKALRVMSIFILVWIILLSSVFFVKTKYNFFPQLIESWTASTEKQAFPAINQDGLSTAQKKVVDLLKKEYASQPDGEKYSGGSEAWCADFVSWVLYRANVPLINPNTDSWRIPGTKTMKTFYETNQRFKSSKEDYTPQVGDVAFYDNPSPYGQHVNFVLKYENGLLTTIGGNEPGGIRISTHDIKSDPGFLGYGLLSE
ncbi:MAG: CHAP domain-containing protein [Candidatus Saccharimonas sp.]